MSDSEQGIDFVPSEFYAIHSASWGQERQQFRETLRANFDALISRPNTGCYRKIITERNDSDCMERDEDHAPSKPGNEEGTAKDSDAAPGKKPIRSGHSGGSSKGNRSGGQNNRKYKGKNRR